MGIASYNRGSVAVSRAIHRDFMEDRGGNSRQLASQMSRAETSVVELEKFCLDAQSLYIDVTDASSASGLLKGWMHEVWLTKAHTKRFQAMLDECNAAHCAWVESDHRNVFIHLQVCRRKARAWLAVISLLNRNNARYHFEIPAIH